MMQSIPKPMSPAEKAVSDLPLKFQACSEFALDDSGRFTMEERIDFLLTLCAYRHPASIQTLNILALRDEGTLSKIAEEKRRELEPLFRAKMAFDRFRASERGQGLHRILSESILSALNSPDKPS